MNIKAIFGTPRMIIANIAQFILGVFLITLLSWIWSWIFPNESPDFLLGIISEIDLFEVWLDLLSQIANSSKQLLIGNYIEVLRLAFFKSIYETLIIGISIHLCKVVGVKAEMRGAAILPTVLGSFLGCFIVKLVNDIEISLFLWVIALAIIDSIVVFLVGEKLLGAWITLLINALIAGMISAYVVVNILIMQGSIQDIRFALGLFIVILFPLLIVILIEQFVTNLLS